MTDGKWRWLLGAVSAGLVVLPLLCVTYPPSMDLAQHVAQVRLFEQAWHHSDGIYRIQWLTPYSVATILLGALWSLVGPLAAGKVALIVLGVASTAAIHWLAWRRGRPAEAAVLASLPFLGLWLYNGFITFMVAWPPFLWWLNLTSGPARPGRRWRLLVGGLVLYFSHALWLAVAGAWLALMWVVRRAPWREAARDLAALSPVALLAGAYALTTRSMEHRHDVLVVWKRTAFERLQHFPDDVFAGLAGWTNAAVVGAMAAWCAAALWQHRRDLRARVDPVLLLGAAMFGTVAAAGPDRILFVVYFASRFAAPALALALLAMPPPRWPPLVSRSMALAIAIAFVSSNVSAWTAYEREEVTGLTESLEALPEGQRVLGLDFAEFSHFFMGRIFVHDVAYAQALRGGTIPFSFAELPSPLIVLKHPETWVKWTHDLEWAPERVTHQDLTWFDYVLVDARSDAHAIVARNLGLTPITTTGVWRLYRVGTPKNQGTASPPTDGTVPVAGSRMTDEHD